MSIVIFLAAGPFGITWQEVILIFLLIAILAGPGLVALGIVFLVLRHQRKKRGVPPPLPTQYTQQQ